MEVAELPVSYHGAIHNNLGSEEWHWGDISERGDGMVGARVVNGGHDGKGGEGQEGGEGKTGIVRTTGAGKDEAAGG